MYEYVSTLARESLVLAAEGAVLVIGITPQTAAIKALWSEVKKGDMAPLLDAVRAVQEEGASDFVALVMPTAANPCARVVLGGRGQAWLDGEPIMQAAPFAALDVSLEDYHQVALGLDALDSEPVLLPLSRGIVAASAVRVTSRRNHGIPLQESLVPSHEPHQELPLPASPIAEIEGDVDTRTHRFDHLFEPMAFASVEQAAVRDAGSEDHESEPRAPQATIYAIALPNGRVESLDKAILVGRGPGWVGDGGAAEMTSIALDDPDRRLSRTHARLLQGSNGVVVVDLDSTNGTEIVRAAGEVTAVTSTGEQMAGLGDQILLGKSVSLRVVELSPPSSGIGR